MTFSLIAAAIMIMNNHYVNDSLGSFESVKEAVALVIVVKLVHCKGGFTLRPLLSNDAEVPQEIGESGELASKHPHLKRRE